MKFSFKKFAVLSVAAVLAFASFAGCKGCGKKTKNSLVIHYYDGGYDQDWAEDLVTRYKASRNTDAEIEMTADANILDTLSSDISEEVPDVDIFISHDINWQQYAQQGYLANLDALYSSKLSDGTTFEDAVLDSVLDYARIQGDGDTSEHYYKVSWTQGAGGLVYNKTMFDEQGWKVPATYAELEKLCEDIVAAKVPVNDDILQGYVVPFTWTGNENYLWDYVVFEWWAQLAGTDKIANLLQYGTSFDDLNGFESYNPANNYAEFKQAYEKWYDLVAKHPQYSINNAAATSKVNAQIAFLTGKAAMMPYAHWAYKELGKTGACDFDMALMPTPKLEGAKGSYNYLVGFGDSIIVSKNCYDLDLALDFIKFMGETESLVAFTDKTEGAFLAFDYNRVPASELTKLEERPFTKSVYEKLTTETNFHLASKHPLAYLTTNKVKPWVNNVYYYVAASQSYNYNSQTGAVTKDDKGVEDPTEVFDQMYNEAKSNWRSWLRSANLIR